VPPADVCIASSGGRRARTPSPRRSDYVRRNVLGSEYYTWAAALRPGTARTMLMTRRKPCRQRCARSRRDCQSRVLRAHRLLRNGGRRTAGHGIRNNRYRIAGVGDVRASRERRLLVRAGRAASEGRRTVSHLAQRRASKRWCRTHAQLRAHRDRHYSYRALARAIGAAGQS
jgi:hypothetical protein